MKNLQRCCALPYYSAARCLVFFVSAHYIFFLFNSLYTKAFQPSVADCGRFVRITERQPETIRTVFRLPFYILSGVSVFAHHCTVLQLADKLLLGFLALLLQ